MAQRIKGITIDIDGNSTGLEKSLKAIDVSLRDTQGKLRDVNKLLKLDPSNTNLLKQKQELLAKSIGDTKKRTDELKSALSAMEKSGVTDANREQFNALQRELAETESKLKSLKKESSDFGSVFSQQLKATGESLAEVGSKLTTIGTSMTTKVTAPIVGVGVAVTKMASDYEDALAKVSTIADTSEVPMDKMSEAIINLSNETGIASTEIADGVYNAISAGQDTADAVNFVSNATKLARAGFADTASATDILTTALNAYGMEASEVEHVSDVLITTQNLGKTTVAELASQMGRAIPTAKAQGVSIENLAAMYATLTANGINTAQSTTYLSSMLNELGKSGSTAEKAFRAGTEHIKQGGLSMQEAMASGWDLTDVLSILDEQAAASGTTIANMFGSAEAGKAATVLYDKAEQLNDVVVQMGDSANATAEAYDKLETSSFNVEKTMNLLKNTGTELGSTVLQMLQPAISNLSITVSKFASWVSGLTEEQKQMIVTIAGVVAAIGPVISIVGMVSTALSGIVTGIGTAVGWIGNLSAAFTMAGGAAGIFSSAMAVITGPIGIAVAAIGGLIAAGVLLYKNWDTIQKWGKTLAKETKTAWNNIKTNVSNAANNARTAAVNAFNGMKSTVSTVTSQISATASREFGNLKNAITTSFNNAKSAVSSAMSNVASTVSSAMNDAISAINSSPIVSAAREKFQDVYNAISGKWEQAKDAAINAIQRIKDKLDGTLYDKDVNVNVYERTYRTTYTGSGNGTVTPYASAYSNAVMFTRPTVLPTINGAKQFGDRGGSELVIGTNKLMNMISAASGGNSIVINVQTQEGQNNRAIANEVYRRFDKWMGEQL